MIVQPAVPGSVAAATAPTEPPPPASTPRIVSIDLTHLVTEALARPAD